LGGTSLPPVRRLVPERPGFVRQQHARNGGSFGSFAFDPFDLDGLISGSRHELVGGLEHFLFSIYWESSAQLTNIFQGGLKPPTSPVLMVSDCVLVHPNLESINQASLG
jgi:hypothetical protein